MRFVVGELIELLQTKMVEGYITGHNLLIDSGGRLYNNSFKLSR